LLAKVHRLEILAITTDGLQPLFDVAINGRIAAMHCMRLKVGALLHAPVAPTVPTLRSACYSTDGVLLVDCRVA